MSLYVFSSDLTDTLGPRQSAEMLRDALPYSFVLSVAILLVQTFAPAFIAIQLLIPLSQSNHYISKNSGC